MFYNDLFCFRVETVISSLAHCGYLNYIYTMWREGGVSFFYYWEELGLYPWGGWGPQEGLSRSAHALSSSLGTRSTLHLENCYPSPSRQRLWIRLVRFIAKRLFALPPWINWLIYQVQEVNTHKTFQNWADLKQAENSNMCPRDLHWIFIGLDQVWPLSPHLNLIGVELSAWEELN